eukprot:m.24400 g.24400  ORF g.24400 m.24400 type:complete len:345 (-) comp8591_c0_seq2:1815-2849(-)
MGGLLTLFRGTPEVENNVVQKKYTWDERPPIDPETLRFHHLTGQVVGKEPGSINSEQFNIDNCKECTIALFDAMASVMIDDCSNCTVFIGPTQSSIFVRNCTNMRIVAACQQFRTRDCTDIDVCLCCHTLPIIEATSQVTFRCFRGSYFMLAGQMTKSKTSIYNNNWCRTYDFTKSKVQPNFSVSTEAPTWLPELFSKVSEVVPSVTVSLKPEDSIVPITSQPGKSCTDESVVLVVFPPAERSAKKVWKRIAEVGCTLVQTKGCKVDAEDAQRIFGEVIDQEKVAGALPKGDVVCFELVGDNAVDVADAIREDLAIPLLTTIKGSEHSQVIRELYSHADALMKI